MDNNEEIKAKPHKTDEKRMLVSYGKMKILGWFTHNLNQVPPVHREVIVQTERGIELGTVVGAFCYKAGQFRWDPEKVSQYYEEQTPGEVVTSGGTFMRFASHEDVGEWRHLEASTKKEIKTTQKMIDEMRLDMKIVEGEHLFGGERIIFYFLAEGRVDFRELVKKLAREFQTRIEMRQIGARDEAKLISDFETCGQECCCSKYLKVLKPVNMRMAKLQKATLDPSKISGYCGRLKCCLRYEDDTYKHLKKQLPPRGTWVKTDQGIGQVVDTQVITQLVIVAGSDGNRFAVGAESVEITERPKDFVEETATASPQRQERPQHNRRQAEVRPMPEVKKREPVVEEDIADADEDMEKDIDMPSEGEIVADEAAPAADKQGQDNRPKRKNRRNRNRRNKNRNRPEQSGNDSQNDNQEAK